MPECDPENLDIVAATITAGMLHSRQFALANNMTGNSAAAEIAIATFKAVRTLLERG